MKDTYQKAAADAMINRIIELERKYAEVRTLLDEVMQNPEHLTDSYYRELGRELVKRYDSLCK